MLLDVLGVQAMDLGSSKRASCTTNQTAAKIDMGEHIVKHGEKVRVFSFLFQDENNKIGTDPIDAHDDLNLLSMTQGYAINDKTRSQLQNRLHRRAVPFPKTA